MLTRSVRHSFRALPEQDSRFPLSSAFVLSLTLCLWRSKSTRGVAIVVVDYFLLTIISKDWLVLLLSIVIVSGSTVEFFVL
jgi:hypothetical protein